MIKLRKSEDRGYADHGWLKSYHSFSFADYYDPEYMGWGNLRVINDDYIEAGGGFGDHPHRNMEIITYVLSGQLAHKDSMGNVETINPGEVHFPWVDSFNIAHTIFMRQLTGKHVSDNLHISMRMISKAPTCFNIVIINNSKITPAHIFGIVIICKRK